MTRLHISENCKQLKIMSITINICIDNALFYLFHITPEQSWSHMDSVFYKYKIWFTLLSTSTQIAKYYQ